MTSRYMRGWNNNSKGNNIVAGGTVRIASTTMPYGANITAKNITDVIDEDIKGNCYCNGSRRRSSWENLKTMTGCKRHD